MVAVKKDGTTYLDGIKLDNQAELLPQVKERLAGPARRRQGRAT